MRRQGSLGKAIILGKVEDRGKRAGPNNRWIDLIKETIGTGLQKLSRAVEDGSLWTSLVLKFIKSWSQLNDM